MELIETPGQAMIVHPGDRAYIEPADESVTPIVWRNDAGHLEVGTREIVDLQAVASWGSPDMERVNFTITCKLRDPRIAGGEPSDDPRLFPVRLIAVWVGGEGDQPSWIQADYWDGDDRVNDLSVLMRREGIGSATERLTFMYRVEFVDEPGVLSGSNVLTSSVTIPARPPAIPDPNQPPPPGDGGSGGSGAA